MAGDNLSCWQRMPDCLLVEVFSFLKSKDLLMTAQTCRDWCRVSYDECLWRRLFLAELWKIRPIVDDNEGPPRLAPGRSSWRSEFERIACHAPTVQCEVLAGHTDQVVHVSFSHDGSLFATCSKDAYVKVWNSNYPASICHSYDFRELKWQYPRFSQFNESDTLLLVSGIPGLVSFLGEIAVFSLEDGFALQCRIQNRPPDIFGTWYTDDYVLSGDIRFLGNQVSCAMIYLNKASQETESVYTSVVSMLYKFHNKNSFIRNIMIANCSDQCDPDEGDVGDCQAQATPDAGSKISEIDVPSALTNRESMLADVDQRDEVDDEGIILDSRDKYLIFTCGLKTCTPHRIGFKKIPPFRFHERLKFINLKDKLAEHRERQLQEANLPPIDLLDEQIIQQLFDKVDHYVDLNGYIIGMALSPDHSRPWPVNCHIEDPNEPPPIAQEIEIHVIDMATLQKLDIIYKSHKAFSPSEECFFILLDVSNSYVASGAENNSGYLWDKHYRHCIAQLPHAALVNSVAFNPRDESVLVTTSDDHLVKVWRSLSFVRQMMITGENPLNMT